jgi:predicted phosphohydrolase
MHIWAIADLHLSFGVKNKSMDFFGPRWADHAAKIAKHWRQNIHSDDLVLIPGDISWALKLEDAIPDLQWIHDLPGTKVILKGNHDFWWSSLSKLKAVLPPSIHFIQNNALLFNDIAIGGARLWDTPEYSFGEFVEYRENPRAKNTEEKVQEDLTDQLFDRELQRLELSLSQLSPQAKYRIAMTHYPPVNATCAPSRASTVLEKHRIDLCVFGHLHNLRENLPLFGNARGIRYVLSACDFLHYNPIQLM